MKKEITVLDTKRSNAINIGLTVLPTARTIKAAILKMDSSVINKEGIEVIDIRGMLMEFFPPIIMTNEKIFHPFDL